MATEVPSLSPSITARLSVSSLISISFLLIVLAAFHVNDVLAILEE